jgi:hypothetical protein
MSNLPQKDLAKFKSNLKLSEVLGVSSIQVNSVNKTSTVSVNEPITSANFLSLINTEKRMGYQHSLELDASSSGNKVGNVFVIEDVANYQSPLKMFRGYRFFFN